MQFYASCRQPVDFSIQRLLISCLIKQGKYYQLQQLFNFDLFEDSLQLAQFLSCLEGERDLVDRGLAMLSRLNLMEDLVKLLDDKMRLEGAGRRGVPASAQSDANLRKHSEMRQ
jgi:hypothetical protein